MSFASQRSPVAWGGVCVALLGAAFCALQADPLQTDIPCPSVGCRLFHDVTLWGISLWWVGTAFFVLTALLCLRRWRGAAFALTALALIADCFLLLLMLLTAPCLSCLGAAAFIGLLFFILRPERQGWFNGPARRPLLLFFWGALFFAAASAAGTEALGRWTLYGQPDAERRVYFSPSCPACRDAIAVFAGNAAFIPVAERDEDFAAIAGMRSALKRGKNMPEALAEGLKGQGHDLSIADGLLLRLRLLRNKAEVLRLGFDKLPLLTINGMPQSLRPDAAGSAGSGARPSASAGSGGSALPPELTPLDQCKEGPAPCPPAP